MTWLMTGRSVWPETTFGAWRQIFGGSEGRLTACRDLVRPSNQGSKVERPMPMHMFWNGHPVYLFLARFSLAGRRPGVCRSRVRFTQANDRNRIDMVQKHGAPHPHARTHRNTPTHPKFVHTRQRTNWFENTSLDFISITIRPSLLGGGKLLVASCYSSSDGLQPTCDG